MLNSTADPVGMLEYDVKIELKAMVSKMKKNNQNVINLEK